MKINRLFTAGAAALLLSSGLAAFAAPADAQSRYDRRYSDRNNDDDAVENAIVGAVVGGIAGAIIGDGDGRSVATGALAGAALGVATSDDDRRGYRGYGGSNGYSYGSTYPRYGYGSSYPSYGYNSYGSYRSDCDYYRDGRCWRNRGHWERENGINSRDGYDRRERAILRNDRWDNRRDWRSDRRDDRRDWRDDRHNDRRWRNY